MNPEISGPRSAAISRATLAALIEDALAYHASRVALEGATPKTFAELDTESRSLAGHLGLDQIDSARPCALVFPPGPLLVAIILAVIRSGRCFICINPSAPAAERTAILELVNPGLVVTGATEVNDTRWKTRYVTSDEPLGPGREFATPVAPDDLAYLVHTSGTTGRPKIIQIEHHSIANLVNAMVPIYALVPGDRRLQLSQPGPDFFIAEILLTLCAGATLVFPRRRDMLGPREFLAQLDEQRITITGLPSSYWRELAAYLARGESKDMPAALRLVIVGMESVDPAALADWNRLVPPRIALLNVYGPAETTMIATVATLREGLPPEETRVPIGRPLPNVCLYILGEGNRLQPSDEIGEIGIAGAGVMRGYAGNTAPDIPGPNPHDSRPGFNRLYRTGDFGYQRADGQFVFVGRQDGQVKIRGHRIELAAVETYLASAAEGRGVAALAIHRRGHAELVGVVVGTEGIGADEIRERIGREVKEAMVPSTILFVEKLPRLPNGKIDRQRLKREAESRLASDAPTAGEINAGSPLETMIAIWDEVFQIRGSNPQSNFFHLGGNSLLGMRLSILVEERLGLKMPLHYLYAAPTLGGLLQRLGSAAGPESGLSLLVPLAEGPGPCPLFAMHGWGGRVFIWPRFAAHFNGERNCWGIQGAEHIGQPRPRTMREMCCRYAEAIREKCGDQPVVLLGYSLGGIIAYETARQYEALGGRVHRVVLLDSPAPKTFVGYLLHCLLEPIRVRFPGLRKLWWKLKGSTPQSLSESPDDPEQAWADAYVPIIQYYFPRESRLPVLFLHCEPDRARPAPGWARILRGPYEWVHAGSSHHEIIREPALSHIAKIVREKI